MPGFSIRKKLFSENNKRLRGIMSESDCTHITKVLRLGTGDRITVFDAESTEYESTITDISPEIIALHVHSTLLQ